MIPLMPLNDFIIDRPAASSNALRGPGFCTLRTPAEYRSDDLTFLATTYTPECDYSIDKHLKGYSTIQLMTSGGVELYYNETKFTLEGAWFWPASPGPRIRFHPAPGHRAWFHRHIGFCGPRVERWVKTGLWPQGPQPAPPGREWGVFFDEMIRLVEGIDQRSYLRAINLLECLLLDLADARTCSENVQEAWLLVVTDRLRHHETFVPDYSHLASDIGMTLSTLRRRFHQAMGMTMQEYVLQSRLSRARLLLTETDLPLKAISEQLGYDSVHFFARQFRQRVGATPGYYRKSR